MRDNKAPGVARKNRESNVKMLEKRVRDLMGDEVARLRKSLGVPGRPYPMRDSVFAENERGERVQIQRLGVLEDAQRPLSIYSDRSYAEVFGMAYREMPTPGMLPMFFDALNMRRPESKRRIQYLKGAPGAGKTYMSELIGRMRDPRGPMVVNCGDKNLAELLYETVLDFGKDRDFYAELERRCAQGRMNPLSEKILEESLGDALVRAGEKTHIDWTRIADARAAIDGLEKVRSLEGLDHLGGNALGMATQEGPLIRAWKEGREIVLDEYNKRKPGTDGGLQKILQFLAGEIDECQAENTLKEKGDQAAHVFMFRREDARAGFFATLTGNDESDGESTFELSQSVHSRTSPEKIPKATVEDWQHRICQILTGIPVSTIYRSDEERWKSDPAFFGAWLKKARTVGMTPQQIENIPPMQMRLLNRWQDVLKASEIMAKFYYGWSMMVDPDSELARSGQLAKLMMEIDDVYKSEVSIDFRKITDHVNKAVEFRPEIRSVEQSGGYTDLNFESPPQADKGGLEEDPMMKYGTRLAHIIVSHISKTTSDIGKTALHKQLMKHAMDCGIIPASFHEAKPSDRPTLALLLDEDPYDDRNADMQAGMIRRMICAHIREKYGRDAVAAADDDILSMAMVRAALESMKQMQGNDETVENWRGLPCVTRDLIVMNGDADTVSGQPLSLAGTLDMAGGDPSGQAAPQAGDLVSEKEFLEALILPRVGDYNLHALWNRAISRSGLVAASEGGHRDRALMAAEGREEENIVATTVIVKADDSDAVTPLHIIWNRVQDRVLVVGNRISAGLSALFNHRGVMFIDRDEKGSDIKAKAALVRAIGATQEDMERLKSAFLLRNMMDDPGEEKTAGLEKILVSKSVTAVLPNYIINRSIRPEAGAA